MRDRLRLPIDFDPQGLLDDLAGLPASDWTDHFVPEHYQGHWRVIPLRAPEGASHPIQMIYSDPGATRFVDTPWLGRCPHCRAALTRFDCELGAARLMSLDAGSVIHEHRDHDLALDQGVVRLHIPITTNPGVEFVLNGTAVSMDPGECWYLRLSDPHRVENRGRVERVHLVIDATVNDWLRELIAGAAASG